MIIRHPRRSGTIWTDDNSIGLTLDDRLISGLETGSPRLHTEVLSPTGSRLGDDTLGVDEIAEWIAETIRETDKSDRMFSIRIDRHGEFKVLQTADKSLITFGIWGCLTDAASDSQSRSSSPQDTPWQHDATPAELLAYLKRSSELIYPLIRDLPESETKVEDVVTIIDVCEAADATLDYLSGWLQQHGKRELRKKTDGMMTSFSEIAERQKKWSEGNIGSLAAQIAYIRHINSAVEFMQEQFD